MRSMSGFTHRNKLCTTSQNESFAILLETEKDLVFCEAATKFLYLL
jgi:hypothetical protein